MQGNEKGSGGSREALGVIPVAVRLGDLDLNLFPYDVVLSRVFLTSH